MAESITEQDTVGKYRLLRMLGRGNMGTVYLAQDPDAGREVALKIVRGKQLAGPDGDLTRALFANEARLGALLDHPNIVSIHGACMDGDPHYIVMEYVPGSRTAQDFCRVDRLLPAYDAVSILVQCASALEHAHSKGVVHRDIKPRNILLTEQGEAKLSDFGIAFSQSPGQNLADAGSPLYMSPEQIEKSSVGPQSDLFSLGIVLYEMVAGKHPFAAQNLPAIQHKILNSSPAPLRHYRADIPPVLEMVVERVLAKNPTHRYQSARDFACDLHLVFDFMNADRDRVSNQLKFDTVRSLEFFQEFPDAELWELISACAWQCVPPAQPIVLEDGVDKSFYIIVSGSVIVTKGADPVDILRPSDCFGEAGQAPKQERSLTMIAGRDVTIMKVHAPMIARASLNCQLRFYKKFLNSVIERLSQRKATHRGAIA
ncbi:MAG: serine/threonine-protein kinase [Gammaproteobacteria bacterium]